MNLGNFKKGDKVYFGRENGEKTLGEIIKINPTRAKVKTLERRGYGRGSDPGTIWAVPYDMLTMANATEQSKPVSKPSVLPKMEYNPFSEDNLLLQAMADVYSSLSPENLSCDGELPMSVVNKRRSILLRKQQGIQFALGYNVNEVQAMEWSRSKAAYKSKSA